MKKKILKKFLIVIAFIFVIGLIGYGTYRVYSFIHEKNITNIEWIRKHTSIVSSNLSSDVYSVSTNKDISIYNSKYQKVINEKLDVLKEETYDFSNALMIYNLYGTNKLSINLYFDTDEESYLDYTISVDDEKISDFSRTLSNHSENNLTKNHQYQLIGFVPGYQNHLVLELKNKDGEVLDTKEITLDFTDVSCYSDTMLSVKNGKSTKELSEGLYTILGNDSDQQDYVAFYDNDGILRGETDIIGYRAHAILFQDDKMYFSISQTRIAEINSLGEVEEVYRTGHYYLHHDYVFDNDGNLLVLANNTEKDTEEDCIIKINLETKEVTEVLDLEDIFSSYVETCKLDTESFRDEGEDGLDWIHINSIEYINGDVILSSRETSSIMKIKNLETNPTLEYILSDPSLWDDTDYEDYVYEKIGDFKIHAGQHSVRYTATDEAGVYYLTFFDNNYGRQASQPTFDYSTIGITNTNAFQGDNSYYYVYKVNENNKTFELTDSFPVTYSGIVSSVQKKENGNVIVDSGTAGIYAEYDENHKLIRKFTVPLNKYMVYRALKYDFNNFWFQ